MTGLELGLLGLLVLVGILNGAAWRSFERHTKREMAQLREELKAAQSYHRETRINLDTLRLEHKQLETQHSGLNKATAADIERIEKAANTDHETLKNVEHRLAALGAEMGYDWQPQKTWAHWKKRDK